MKKVRLDPIVECAAEDLKRHQIRCEKDPSTGHIYLSRLKDNGEIEYTTPQVSEVNYNKPVVTNLATDDNEFAKCFNFWKEEAENAPENGHIDSTAVNYKDFLNNFETLIEYLPAKEDTHINPNVVNCYGYIEDNEEQEYTYAVVASRDCAIGIKYDTEGFTLKLVDLALHNTI